MAVGAFAFARLLHLRGIYFTPQMGLQGKIFCYFVERMGRGPQKLAAAIAETGTDRPGGRSLQRIGEVVTTTFIIPFLKVFEGS
jgi:hypothetical protein